MKTTVIRSEIDSATREVTVDEAESGAVVLTVEDPGSVAIVELTPAALAQLHQALGRAIAPRRPDVADEDGERFQVLGCEARSHAGTLLAALRAIIVHADDGEEFDSWLVVDEVTGWRGHYDLDHARAAAAGEKCGRRSCLLPAGHPGSHKGILDLEETPDARD